MKCIYIVYAHSFRVTVKVCFAVFILLLSRAVVLIYIYTKIYLIRFNMVCMIVFYITAFIKLQYRISFLVRNKVTFEPINNINEHQ